MADMSQNAYIETLEEKTKIIANYFSDDLRRAEETQDFSQVKQRMPLILDMISVYDDLGTSYYSQTCSEFLGMLARIQKGLGMEEELRNTLTALTRYQNGVGLQDVSHNVNPVINDTDTNVNPNLSPSMY